MSINGKAIDEGMYSPVLKKLIKDCCVTADILAVWKSRDVR